MKKILLFFVLMILGLAPGFCVTLEGKVSYTEDSAREVLFEGVNRTVDKSVFSSYAVDPDVKENKDYMKNGLEPVGRNIEVFKRGGMKLAYAVQYDENPCYSFYYLKWNGVMAFFDVNNLPKDAFKKDKIDYPVKSYRYNYNGELIAAALVVSDEEAFLFDQNGKLLTHRIDNVGYNRKGRKIWTSEFVDN